MRNFKVLVFVVFMLGCGRSEGQSWVWGSQGVDATNGDVEGWNLTKDYRCNLYLTGDIRGSCSFGSLVMHASSPGGSIYIAKFDSNGNPIWENVSTGYGGGDLYGSTTDKGGNTYSTGVFVDTMDFGSYKIFSPFTQNIFLVKYDTGGYAKWAIQGHESSVNCRPVSESVAVDSNGNVYISGYFNDTLVLGIDTLKSILAGAFFIAKYDSSGNFKWAHQSLSGTNSQYARGFGVAADKLGNAYATGYFYQDMYIGNDTLANGGFFLLKYDSIGNLIWATKTITFCIPATIILDNERNIYITGFFGDSVQFGAFDFHGNIHHSIFLVKYNSVGNVVWANAGISNDSNGWSGYSLAIDKSKNVYLSCGEYGNRLRAKVIFNRDTFALDSATDALLVAKFDSNGKMLCGSILPSGGDDNSGITLNPSETFVYVGGDFWQNVIVGKDTLYEIPYSEEYPFIAKWQPCSDTNITTSIPPISTSPSLTLFPNPNTGAFTLEVNSGQGLVDSKMQVEVYNVLGEKVYSSNYSLSTNHYSLDLSSQPNGIYLYRVMDDSGALVGSGKFVIQK